MATTTYTLLTDLKKAVGIPVDDTTDDTLLNRAIASASAAINKDCGRRFWRDDAPTVRSFRLDQRAVWIDGEHHLVIDDIATTDGLLVEVGRSGGTWSTVATYDTGPDNALADGEPITGLLHHSWWPTGHRQRARITAVWGWPEVPTPIEEATRLLAARRFRRKDSPEGVMGSADWGAVRVSRVDPDVLADISHFVLPGFG